MAKNSRMVLCCQNRVSKDTSQHYGLCVAMAPLVTVCARLTGEEEKIISTKQSFSHFQVSYLKHFNSSYKWFR